MITGLAMVKAAFDMYAEDFTWKSSPYEYVFDRNPFDVIAGNTKIRESFENGVSIQDLKASWEPDEEDFRETRKEFLLY